MLKNNSFDNIKKNHLYFMPSGDVVRVVKVNYNSSTIIVRNYHSHSNEAIDIQTASDFMQRAYNIGQVSRIVKKKPSTIRKYENDGLLATPKKIFMKPGGERPYRVYSQKEVDEIVDFFEQRRSAGRPRLEAQEENGKLNVKYKLDVLQKEKLNG